MLRPLRIGNPALHGLLLALLGLACCGCANGGTLKLDPRESDASFTQDFSSAYITQSGGGEYDVVLVDVAEYKRQKSDKPLQPQPLAPTRQVMHLHLYWRPVTEMTRNPAAVNAAIDWYVLGSDAASQDVVLYEGAGVVTIEGTGGRRQVVITEGTVRPRESRGAMRDPIGGARISGRFTAEVNRSRVREILNEMDRTATSSAASR